MTNRHTADPELCLVFPCYNEEEVLPDLLAVLKSLDLGVPMRFLFIDDGSQGPVPFVSFKMPASPISEWPACVFPETSVIR